MEKLVRAAERARKLLELVLSGNESVASQEAMDEGIRELINQWTPDTLEACHGPFSDEDAEELSVDLDRLCGVVASCHLEQEE
ncbi:hypothetical protein PG994_002160 [Apiospora phragmitis]|uniref:Uncharacterized protein n=1 Tax=Apiospora phragmitis TaxID=2905665 RepID=A0ABR1WVJ5_9PEZI